MSLAFSDWIARFRREIGPPDRGTYQYCLPGTNADFEESFISDAGAASLAICQAVQHYAADPSALAALKGNERFFLVLRLEIACHALLIIEREGAFADWEVFDSPPDPNNIAQFLNWALVDVWNAVSEVILRNRAADFYKQIADLPVNGLVGVPSSSPLLHNNEAL